MTQMLVLFLCTFQLSRAFLDVELTFNNPFHYVPNYITFQSNTTFWINCTLFQYCALTIKQLQFPIKDMLLLYRYSMPPYQQNDKLNIDGADFHSYALKEPIHYANFLNRNQSQIIYVTILSSHKIILDILVEGSQKPICLNQCNKQGICFKGNCKCNFGLIGRDCFIKATQLTLEPQQVIAQNNQTVYFYYEYSKRYRYNFKLSLTAQNSTIAWIGVIVPKIIYIPTEKYHNFQDFITKGQTATCVLKPKQDDDIYYEEYDDIDSVERVIIGVWFINENKNQDQNPIIQISCLISQNSFNYMLLVYILSPIGVFGLLGLFLGIYYKKQKQRQQNQLSKKYDPTKNQNQINLNKYYGIITTQGIIEKIEDNCVICLEPLNNCNIIVFIKCQAQHYFHEDCAQQWLEMHKTYPTCPTCRKPLK